MVLKVPPPATGTCEWVGRAGNGNPLLRINDLVYEVEQTPTGYRLYRGLGGDYPVDVAVYELVTTWGSGDWTCSCPDAQHRRPGACKHCRALRKAVRCVDEATYFRRRVV